MQYVEIIKVIILGIIEGITEWLPISSTGHMILADKFISLNMSALFKEMFFVVIQLGAIFAVIVIYWKKLFPFSFKEKLTVKKDILFLWSKILIATIPAAIIGLKFNDKIDELFYNPWTVSLMLILYGVLFILIEKLYKNRKPTNNKLSDLSYKTAFIIGIFQLLALIPGTSRSGATIIGAMLIGTSREIATEFTFFLAIPVMFGASLVKLIKFGFAFTSIELFLLLLGMVIAFIVSILAIKFLVNYIKKNNFIIFGIYRIILGIILVLLLL